MGGSSSSKSKLGKIALQQRLVSSEELESMLAKQRKRPGFRLASIASRLSAVTIPDDLAALSDQHGVPPVVLSQMVITLGQLVLVPEEIAREHSVLPFDAGDDGVLLAMATPWERSVVEEMEFLTGQSVRAYVAAPEDVRLAIVEAYAAHALGEALYAGAEVSREERDAVGLSVGTPESTEPVQMVELPTPPEQKAAPAPVAVMPARVIGVGSREAAEPKAASTETSGPRLDPAFSEPPLMEYSPLDPVDLSDRKMLIADPAGHVATALGAALEETGIQVARANTGSAAIIAARDDTPDVLVLDATLPEIHGLDVCRRLRGHDRYSQLPILVFSSIHTGWRLEADLLDCYGVSALFETPGDVASLASSVVRLLRGEPLVDAPGPLVAEVEEQMRLGMAAFEAGDLDRAILHLEAGVRIDPDAFQMQYHLGLLYGRRDDLFPAIEALEAATRLQKHHFSALKNLAVVYQRACFRRKALETWERAMWTAPDEATRVTIKDHMVNLL